ncbi:ROK family transcriptional regulator [Streptomyces sp. BH-SS-21]|uniref:ROK family transcriptional regulator n=1 Tax=Streptomyces liliiviolaceus TaxID=2823109 RepID=A0A940Y948_9ACTN|nr:ROK family transcriptional regulator [Streptomyces liliiviolaceus]MBQ0855531.1 ROK family transcriptional regulator [Streptomyces liliiviolaceus]
MSQGQDDHSTPHGNVSKPTSGVRRGNVQRVLEALRLGGPSSQAALARRTDLSRATVNSIVKKLRAEGVAEVYPVNGRETLVALVSTSAAVISVQVNVGAVRAALFDLGSRTRTDAYVPLGDGAQGGDPGLVTDLVRSLAGQASLQMQDLAGIAVGMQAPISRDTGIISSWARLQLPSWTDVPVAASLTDALGVPVVAENDANLAALAEWTWGAGQGSADFLYVMCAGGVGGGLVIDGRIYRGADGLAGEIGHMVLETSGPVCFCGSRGCLTTFVSERSILAALDASGSSRKNLREVVAGARKGDPACRRVLYEAGRHLGRAFANTAKLMAPSVIAVGGVLSEAGPLLFDSIQSSVEVHSLRAVSPSLRFTAARLGDDATLLGGAALVLAETGQGLSTLPGWARSRATVQKSNSSARNR